jgi:hypothetical protein
VAQQRVFRLRTRLEISIGRSGTSAVGGQPLGMQFDDNTEKLDETGFTLSFALRGKLRRIVHEYDVGDWWTHEVVIEDLEARELERSASVGGPTSSPQKMSP